MGALAVEEAIPVATLTKSAPNFATAFTRLDRTVGILARARGVSVSYTIAVEAPLFDGGPIVYRIDLSGGMAPATLHLEHQVFTASNDYFVAFAIPQLESAIDKLRAR